MYDYKRKTLWIFLCLIGLFISPILCAHLLYKHGRAYLIKHSSHYGTLLQSPLNIKQWTVFEEDKPLVFSSIAGKWLLLYIHQERSCEVTCMQRLYSMKQIRSALGKESQRVIGWFLTLPSLSLQIESQRFGRLGVHHGQISQSMLKSAFNSMPYDSRSGFYLIDPLGNLILAYSKDENPNHILKDLKRLLRASRIG